MKELDAYLRRIDYTGSRKPSVETLRQLHRAHLLAIPYENLDIHLGRKLTLDLDQIYHKIVEKGRGGWCYEMNGLLAWALRELGFEVTLLGSSVGAAAEGGVEGDLDHLTLLVQIDQPWLADVGFGNAFVDPLPLRPGDAKQGWMTFQIEQDGDKWFFHNQPYGGAGYGFTLLPRQYSGFAPRCHELQTSPESGFVRNTVCHRHTPEGITTLRGAVLRRYGANGVAEAEIESLEQYRSVLSETFALNPALAEPLWEGVQERHQQWKQQSNP
ncbi:MAG: arylamine N-acetyltransferase [Caldilineaceae bacterium]